MNFSSNPLATFGIVAIKSMINELFMYSTANVTELFPSFELNISLRAISTTHANSLIHNGTNIASFYSGSIIKAGEVYKLNQMHTLRKVNHKV